MIFLSLKEIGDHLNFFRANIIKLWIKFRNKLDCSIID